MIWAAKQEKKHNNEYRAFETCLVTNDKEVDVSLMIADSGATVHMRRHTDDMFDMREEKCVVKYGNGA
jgi:hypothetical protein